MLIIPLFFVGSVDVIRIWDVKLGHVIHKMSTGRAERHKQTIVWALHVFKDFTIVSGDSRGILSFWDGKVGSQIDTNKAMNADILCIGVNEEENVLHCSGIEPSVKTFANTMVKSENLSNQKWVRTVKRIFHTNDVKSLICSGTSLLSGGIDGYLALSSITPNSISKYGPFLNTPSVIVSPVERVTLFRYFNYLELWKLGHSMKNEILYDIETGRPMKTGLLHLTEMPEKYLELRSLSDNPIVSASLSPDAKWLVYTTSLDIRLYSLTLLDGQKPTLTKIKNLPDNFIACNYILFSHKSDKIFLIKNEGVIDVFEIANNELDHTQTIDTSKCMFSP